MNVPVFLTLAATVSIVAIFVFLTVLAWPATKAMPVAWLITVIVATSIWRMSSNELLAASVKGMLGALNILTTVFGGMLMLYMFRESGAMDRISWSFVAITPDSRIQAIIIGFL